MNLPKYAKIKISNMVVTGNFGFKKFLNYDEINKLVKESHFGWNIINQDTTPQLSTYIVKEDKSTFYLQLWHTGRFYMTGIRLEKEIQIYFKEILKELKQIVPKVFENSKQNERRLNKKE